MANIKEDGKRRPGWFKQLTGKSLNSLDQETRELAEKLGPDGIRNFASKHAGMTRYRDEMVSPEDLQSIHRQVKTLREQGGGKWAEGEGSIGRDTPEDWFEDEEDYLNRR